MEQWRPQRQGASTTVSSRAASSPPKARTFRSDDLALDRMIHEPARLAILTVLSSAKAADFAFLRRATALTKGNLSSHLTKLENANLVRIEKTFVDRKPNTRVALTALGKERIARHWRQLERLKSASERL